MKIKSIFLIVALLLSTGFTVDAMKGEPQETPSSVSISAETSWYNEYISTSVDIDGRLWGNVALEGSSIVLGDYDPDAYLTPEVKDIFEYGNIWVGESYSPDDRNVWISLKFSTNDPATAELYAKIIMSQLSSYVTQFDVQFEGSVGESWDSGTNSYRLTAVTYSGHVDWIHFNDIVSNSVPRSIGGIAETIDVSKSTGLSFYFWSDSTGISGGIGLEYRSEILNQTGGHALSLKDLIPVTSFSPATGSNGLFLYHSFPNVTGLTYSLTNTSSTEVSIWSRNDSGQRSETFWYIYAQIYGGVYDDIVMSFDYEFTQWSWTNSERFQWDIDERGYSNFLLQVQGKYRVAPTPNLLFNSSLFTDIESLWFGADQQVDVIPGHDGIWLDVYFPIDYNSSLANSTVQLIADELSTLGYQFTSSDIGTSSYWSPTLNQYVEKLRVSRYGDLNQSTLISAISSSYTYSHSVGLRSIDLNEVQAMTWSLSKDRWGFAGTMGFSYSQTHKALYNSTPFFEQGISNVYTVDLLSSPIFNLNGTIPWDSESEVVNFVLKTPFEGDWENITYVPSSNSGIGWQSWRWPDNSGRIQRFSYELSVFSDSPLVTSDVGDVIGPLTEISVSFRNTFLLDSDDVERPWGNLYKRGSSPPTGYFYSDYSYLPYNTVVNGTLDLGVTGRDYTEFVWNGTELVPRYPPSGVVDVNGTMYRTDAPVDHPLFNVPLNFVRNSLYEIDRENYWTTSLDTLMYPDGTWMIDLSVTDAAGNVGGGGGMIIIDNYNSSYTPSVITWSADTPVNGSGISGIAGFDFNITDDAGTYTTILWTNLGGNIITPVDTLEVDGQIVSIYHFDFDTLVGGVENQEITFTIETLDMDGHWSSSVLKVVIDNRKIGEPPQVSLVSPLDGISVNKTENGEVLFTADVQDDWGIASVILSFGGDEFYMFYNETSGLYELKLDLTTRAVGTYTWKVIATDIDENTHVVESESRVLNLIGISTSVDTTPPTLTLIEPTNGETVSGEVSIKVSAIDDTKVLQVTLTLPDNSVVNMVASGNNYSYVWDSTQVADGTYSLKIRAVDNAGNDVVLTLTLDVSNGRTPPPPPQFGLPGFEFPAVFLAVFIIAGVARRKKYWL